MNQRRTVLAHLASRLTEKKTEDIAVEALAHILSESKSARAAIQSVLRDGGSQGISISRFRTQMTGESGERPDLSGFDEIERECLLIEAKFWAGLTSAQPVEYLKRLSDQKRSSVIFVAPETRLTSLWNELKNKIAEDGKMRLGTEKQGAGVHSIIAGNRRRMILVSWRVLLDRMWNEATAKNDSKAADDIRQLQGLCEQQDDEALFPIKAGQTGPEFPRFVLSVYQLIGDVSEQAFGTSWASRRDLKAGNSGGYFQNMWIYRTQIWFGVQFHLWAHYRDTPLWLGFYDGGKKWQEILRRLEGLKTLQTPAPEYVKEAYAIAIPLPHDVEYHVARDRVVQHLAHVAELLKSRR